MKDSLHQKAISILQGNDRGGYTIPTARLYPYQWNWDSAFIALGIAAYDNERAWQEIISLIEGQWPDGMIPSILFRSDDPDYFPGPKRWGKTHGKIPSTGISQPPVLATIVRLLLRENNNEDLKKAENIFDALFKYHKWFHDCRTDRKNGVVCTVHPWETGRDNSPDWIDALSRMDIPDNLEIYQRMDDKHVNPTFRPTKEDYDKYLTIVQFGKNLNWDQRKLTDQSPFLMADPNIHFILLRANKDLLALSKLLKKPDDISNSIINWIEQMEKANNYFWNDKINAFCARDTLTDIFSEGFTHSSALCFYADTGTEHQRNATITHIERVSSHVKFMIPSWDPERPAFEPQRYWCGPIWPQMNFIVSLGLEEQGYVQLSHKIKNDLRELIEFSGFWECFNPLTGDGCVGNNFSWTAAMWLAWLEK